MELYRGDSWERPSHPPQLLETLDFDAEGRLLRRESFAWAHETVVWTFNAHGQLTGIERTTKPLEVNISPQTVRNPWVAYQYGNSELPFSPNTSPPIESKQFFTPQGRLQTRTVTSLGPSATRLEQITMTYNEAGDVSRVEQHEGSEGSKQSYITYQYDEAGNWIAQQREDGSDTEKANGRKYHFLRRISYHPGAKREKRHRDLRYMRNTFGLRGPVTAIEGPALLERLTTDGTPDAIGVPFNTYLDRVEFDGDGRVSATAQWDGNRQPENLLKREQFIYHPQGAFRARTVTVMQPPFRSYAVSGMRGFLLGNTLLPLSRPHFLGNRDAKQTYRYDESGRLIEENFAASDGSSAHAVCHYTGDNGLITVMGDDGVVTDRIRLDITRDRYGNLLSRRFVWEVEAGTPSTRSQEVRYQLTYAGRQQTQGVVPGVDHTRVTVRAAGEPSAEAWAIALSGPTPATLYHALSEDNGKTWTPPAQLARYESEFDEAPAISLVLDAAGQPWFAFAELSARLDRDPGPRYSPGRRSAARIIIGSW